MTQKSAAELVAEAKSRIREVTPSEAMASEGNGQIYLDCREPQEYNVVHIPGAVFIPLGQVESKVEAAIPRGARVVVYCARGNRSALAADTMTRLGYTDVVSMSSGIGGWVDAGGEVE